MWLAASLVADSSRLYLAQYDPMRSGCEVVAFDLATGKQVWARRVVGLGLVVHSRYSNKVSLRLENSRLVVLGEESAGRYVEVMSPSGELVSTRVIEEP